MYVIGRGAQARVQNVRREQVDDIGAPGLPGHHHRIEVIAMTVRTEHVKLAGPGEKVFGHDAVFRATLPFAGIAIVVDDDGAGLRLDGKSAVVQIANGHAITLLLG